MRWAVGVLDKVKFWKRDDFSSDRPSDPQPYDLGAQQFDPSRSDPMMQQPDMNPDSFPQQFSQQSYPQSQPFPGSLSSRQQVPQVDQYAVDSGIHQRDVELILAKLDAIKSDLDALHQRVRKIEQATDNQPQQKRYW
jgi:hypothetical protein